MSSDNVQLSILLRYISVRNTQHITYLRIKVFISLMSYLPQFIKFDKNVPECPIRSQCTTSKYVKKTARRFQCHIRVAVKHNTKPGSCEEGDFRLELLLPFDVYCEPSS